MIDFGHGVASGKIILMGEHSVLKIQKTLFFILLEAIC